MLLLSREFICFLYILFQNIAFSSIISLITDNHLKSSKIVLFSLIVAATFLVCGFIFPTPNIEFLKLLNSMFILINCVLVLNLNVFTSLIITTIYSCIVFIVNVLCFLLNVLNSSYSYILYQTFVFTLVVSILYKYLHNIQISNLLSKFEKVTYENLEIHFLLLILILSYDFSSISNVELGCSTLYFQLLSIIFIVQLIKNKIIFENLNANIKTLILENENSKYLIDNFRVFKHDYSNTLCSIGGYISLNDMNGLRKFYSKLTTEVSNTNNIQKINTISINEPSIYNLFASKYKTILKNNLKFDFYSTINYKNLYISPYELSKILGIFLDNAIEASSISNEKELFISCETLKNKKQQIIVKNSYLNKDVDINKIYLKGYSSKSIKSGLRIMGSIKNYKKYSKYLPTY